MARKLGAKDKTKRKNKLGRNVVLGVGGTTLVTGGVGIAARKGVLGNKAKGAAILGEILARGTVNKVKQLVTKKS